MVLALPAVYAILTCLHGSSIAVRISATLWDAWQIRYRNPMRCDNRLRRFVSVRADSGDLVHSTHNKTALAHDGIA